MESPTSKSTEYKRTSKGGKIVVFSQSKKREGYEADLVNLEDTFKNLLKCTYIVYEDLAAKKINEYLELYVKGSEDPHDYIMFIVLAHGGYLKEDDKVGGGGRKGELCIKAHDGIFVPVRHFKRLFTANSIKGYTDGQPRVLLINCCRDVKEDLLDTKAPMETALIYRDGTPIWPSFEEMETNYDVPMPQANYCIVYSTVEGRYSYRHPKQGTLLVHELCKEIKSNPEKEFLIMIRDINSKTSYKKLYPTEKGQVVLFQSTLTKEFKLAPKKFWNVDSTIDLVLITCFFGIWLYC